MAKYLAHLWGCWSLREAWQWEKKAARMEGVDSERHGAQPAPHLLALRKRMRRWYGLSWVIPNSYVEVLIPAPQNRTVFGNTIFNEVKIRSLRWVLIQYDWCPYKKRKSGHSCTQRKLDDNSQAGIKIAGRNTNNLMYADDTTLIVESEEALKSLWWGWKRRVKKLT